MLGVIVFGIKLQELLVNIKYSEKRLRYLCQTRKCAALPGRGSRYTDGVYCPLVDFVAKCHT